MPFQPAVNCAEAAIKGVLNGQNVVNSLFYRFAVPYGQSDIQALADAVDTAFSASFDNLMPAAYQYVRTDVRGLTSAIDMQASQDAGAFTGLQVGSSQNNNVTLAVARRSGMTGRGARGRIFIPGIADANLAAPNLVSVAFANAVIAGLEAIDLAAATADWEAVILHRVAGGVPLATATIFTLLEWVVVDLVTDSMRRRLPGRGS